MSHANASIYLSGPWSHRSVSANGTRFHVAESGDGPLVLLLHGFPEFWWTWRRQLSSLSEAGYRVVAWCDRSARPTRSWSAMTGAGSLPGQWPLTIPKLSAALLSSRCRIRFGCGRRCFPRRLHRPGAWHMPSASSCQCFRNGACLKRTPAGLGGCSKRGQVQAGPTRRPSVAIGTP